MINWIESNDFMLRNVTYDKFNDIKDIFNNEIGAIIVTKKTPVSMDNTVKEYQLYQDSPFCDLSAEINKKTCAFINNKILYNYSDNNNISILLSKSANTLFWNDCFITNIIPEYHSMSKHTYPFPLYIYKESFQ